MSIGYQHGDKELKRINLCLCLGGLATFATIYATQPLLPTLTKTFEITPPVAALSVSYTCLALGIVLLFVGPISERFGRVPVMLSSVFISSFLCIGSAFVDNWDHFLVIRALLGISVAGLPAVATTYIREEVHDAWAMATTGLYIGGTAIGGMLGRFVAGALADIWDWRAAMGGIGAMSLICSILMYLLLPRSQNFTAITIHPKALLKRSWVMISDPVLILLYAIGFIAMGTFVSVFNVIGFRLEAPPYNFSVALAGLIYLTYISGSIASYVSGRLSNRLGVRRILIIGCFISAAGLAITLFTPIWLLLIGIIGVVIGFFIVHATASSWIAARAERLGDGIAQATSLYLFFYYLGSSSIGTLTPAVWTTHGWSGVVGVTGMLIALSVLIALALYRFKRLGPAPIRHKHQHPDH